tara:strand:- start:35 stop:172 length:138 start_codon:yes stop_codon:yes gene_type:complete
MTEEQEKIINKIAKMVLDNQIVWVSAELGLDLDTLQDLKLELENE